MTYIQREPHPHYHCLARMSCIFSPWVLAESNDVPWKQESELQLPQAWRWVTSSLQSALQLPPSNQGDSWQATPSGKLLVTTTSLLLSWHSDLPSKDGCCTNHRKAQQTVLSTLPPPPRTLL